MGKGTGEIVWIPPLIGGIVCESGCRHGRIAPRHVVPLDASQGTGLVLRSPMTFRLSVRRERSGARR